MLTLLRLLLVVGISSTAASELFKAIDGDNAAMINIALKSGKKARRTACQRSNCTVHACWLNGPCLV